MFDENYYLANNPDVAAAVRKGGFGGSAARHYQEYGQREGRAGSESQALGKQLTQLQSTRPNPADLYNKAQNDLGVGDVRGRVANLRSQILNTENLLNQVEGSVSGRTQGSLVTEAQRQRLINLEREPIAKQYSTFSGDLNAQEGNLRDLMGEAARRAEMEQSGFSQREDALLRAIQLATGREEAAEDRRRWEADQASARRAAAAMSGLSGNWGSNPAAGGDQPVTAKAPAAPANYVQANDLVRAARLKLGAKANWGSVAALIEKDLGKIPSGSYLDLALRNAFTGRTSGEALKAFLGY